MTDQLPPAIARNLAFLGAHRAAKTPERVAAAHRLLDAAETALNGGLLAVAGRRVEAAERQLPRSGAGVAAAYRRLEALANRVAKAENE